jgi:histidinol-phosphate aminotransferase
MSEVAHGSLDDGERARLAAAGIRVTDLSANINPYGPHRRVVRAARMADFARYPSADASELREAYAGALGLSPHEVLAGNGSSELIYLVARAFASDGRTAMVVEPTFGEYRAAVEAAGGRVHEFRSQAEDGFALDLEALVARIDAVRPALLFICNPNNPTGTVLDRAAMDRLTAATAAAGGRVVVDEAYMDLARPLDESVRPGPARLVLRSLTKLHAIPGLRVGLLLGCADDIATVARLQPPWPVSVPAMAAALQALREERFARDSVRRLARTRTRMALLLREGGWVSPEPAANFFLVHVADGAAFRGRMIGHGFAVRDCASFGLPEYVRIAVPRDEMVEPLMAALKECRV